MCDTYWSVDDCAWTRSPMSGDTAGVDTEAPPVQASVPDQRLDQAAEPVAS